MNFPVRVIRFVEVLDVEVNALLRDGTAKSLRIAEVVKEVGQAVHLEETVKGFCAVAGGNPEKPRCVRSVTDQTASRPLLTYD